jgi:acyl-homoserine-lactone acylase
MLFGNPHFPWSGPLRMFQSQLTIPGKMNVSGASLLGVPMVMIGHTQRAAWSHTVSTAMRFVIFKLDLQPGNPTTYIEGGTPVKMKGHRITVQVKQDDGSLTSETRTLYSTKHGNVLTEIGPASLPWTDSNAYVIQDPNLESFRVINHFYEVNRAQSVGKIEQILDRYQAIPWVNTIAADSAGNAFYGDIGSIPNVPNEKVTQCGENPGLWALGRVAILDGSRSSCLLAKSPDAAVAGILPRDLNPRLTRQDYATNMNDSYWLANPEQPLTGYPRIIGDENQPRSLRTRNGLVQIAEQLAGDGKFGLSDVQAQLTNGFNYGAEALKGGVIEVCNAAPGGILDGVDVSGACLALEGYGNSDTLDDPGALLWRRIMGRLPYRDANGLYTGALYASPFELSDPVNTPFGSDPANPEVAAALVATVEEFDARNVDYDVSLRAHQFVTRNGERIPIPGGPGNLGVYNAIGASFDSATLEYNNVISGSSFVIAASLNGKRCPDVRTVLTYSQAATNAASPYYADQTRLFSNGGSVTDRFCKSQQLKDPNLKVRKLNGGSKQDRRGW